MAAFAISTTDKAVSLANPPALVILAHSFFEHSQILQALGPPPLFQSCGQHAGQGAQLHLACC